MKEEVKIYDAILDLTECKTVEDIIKAIENDLKERGLVNDSVEEIITKQPLHTRIFASIKKAFHMK